MTLIENWQVIAAKAWSSRLAWLAVILSALEVSLPYLQVLVPVGIIPQGLFAAAALVVSAASAVARIVQQPKMAEAIATASDPSQ